jgi:hypothetical protein
MLTNFEKSKSALKCLSIVGIVTIGNLPGFARDKYETIEAWRSLARWAMTAPISR